MDLCLLCHRKVGSSGSRKAMNRDVQRMKAGKKLNAAELYIYNSSGEKNIWLILRRHEHGCNSGSMQPI